VSAEIVSVNAGRIRPQAVGNRVRDTAIDKRPLAGAVDVDHLGLVPDEQADRKYHGGPEQALYAFAVEDYDHWIEQLGRPLAPGQFGENLTTRGIDVNAARIGEQWRVGAITVQVTGPRIPCVVFAAHLDEKGWVRRFAARDRTGAYLRVVTPGKVRGGDEIVVLDRPDHGVTVSDAHRIHRRDRHEAERLVDLPCLVTPMAEWAREQVARRHTQRA
jgi:MOSC domain-containing protein YiiM